MDDNDTKVIVRSIRFRKDQYEAIKKTARKYGLDFSTYVRQAALEIAGVGKEEVDRLQVVAERLERLASR